LLRLAREERLVEEIRRGNEIAFEAIYDRHCRDLLSFCRHMLGSHEEAEDALQQSFAGAWSYLQSDRPAPPQLKPWLYAIARNRCLSLLRARRPEQLELDDVPSTADLTDEVGRRADLRALVADLQRLPDEMRTALLLSELGDLRHADIADVLGRNEAGVKALVYRARSTLIDLREARDITCEQVREHLSVLRRGALRRQTRWHLQDCPDCRAFRTKLRTQRASMALILPVAPSVELKSAVLAAAGLGGAAASGGTTAGGSAMAGLGALCTPALGSATAATVALVTVIAGGGLVLGENAPGGKPPEHSGSAPVAMPAGHQLPRGDSVDPNTPAARHPRHRLAPRADIGAEPETVTKLPPKLGKGEAGAGTNGFKAAPASVSSGQTRGRRDQPHGKSDQPHGKSDQPHGKSDQPHQAAKAGGPRPKPPTAAAPPSGRAPEPRASRRASVGYSYRR